MAIDVVKGLQIEPLFTFNYDIRIADLDGNDQIRYRAQRVTVPGFSFNAEAREEGNLRIKYAMEENVDDVTITVVETTDRAVWNFGRDWRNLIRTEVRNRRMPSEYKKLVFITKLDRQLQPAYSVVANGAFLTRLSPYTLDHTDNSMVEIELVLSVDRVEALPGQAVSGFGLF